MKHEKYVVIAIAALIAFVGCVVVYELTEESDAVSYYYLEAEDIYNNDYGNNFYFGSVANIYITDSIVVENNITVQYIADVSSFTVSSSNNHVVTTITKNNYSSGQMIDWKTQYWDYNSGGYTFQYGIYYHANGGTNAPSAQYYSNVTTNVNEVTLSSSAPTPPTGANFLGWSEDQTASDPEYYPGDTIYLIGEGLRWLYAIYETQTVYTYNLVYDARGGTNAPATQTWTGTATSYEFTITSSRPTPPSGSTFYGWNDDLIDDYPEFVSGDTITLTASGSNTTITTTLYAIYDLPLYTVTINVADPASGTVSPSVVNNVPKYTPLRQSNLELEIGQTIVTLTPNPGYSSGYWSSDVSPGTLPVSIESNMTITAHLTTRYYTVYFDNDYSPEGTVSPTSIQNIPYNSPITVNGNTITINGTTVTATPNPGYFFDWWDCVVPGGSIPSTVTDVMRFTAYFTDERTYYLYYDMNGGTPQIPADTSITPSTTTSYDFDISWTVPTKTGYVFQGWCASPAATVVDYHPGDRITVTWAAGGTQTLYAVWELGTSHVFNLYYDMNGGSPQIDTQTYEGSNVTTVHTFRISSVIPTKEGYDFMGWSIYAAGTSVDYSPGNQIRVGWDVESGTGNRTIYAVWEENDTPVLLNGVYWSNDLYNGSVKLACRFTGGNMNATHLISIPLYKGNMTANNQPTWEKTNYQVDISISYPNTIIVITVSNNGAPLSGFPVTADLGKWSGFELQIEAEKGVLNFTPMNRFNNFTSYTTYSEREQTIADWSEYTSNNAVFRILHRDEGAGAPMSFQVVNTKTFLDTFGVVMTDPSINVHDYFPDYDKVRLNFYSFALYGDSFTLNGKTFPVTEGSVTIYYFKDYSGMNHWLASIDSPTPTNPYGERYVAQSKTMMLSNIYVTWNGDTCSLTFVNDKFTVDLGTYSAGDESVSFTGFWYFTTTLYEPVTVTEKSIDGSWKAMPDIGGPAMILLYLGVLLGLGLIAHVKLGLKWLDLTVLAIGMVLGFTLLG